MLIVYLGSDSGHCNLSSPAYLEWDALTIYLESVLSQYLLTDKPKPAVEEGIALLKAFLNTDFKVSLFFK